MALTFGTIQRGFFGKKRMHIVPVTHDGSETSIDASDLDMNYIDHAFGAPNTVPVGSAGTTDQIDLTTYSGKALAMTALSSGAICTIIAIGS